MKTYFSTLIIIFLFSLIACGGSGSSSSEFEPSSNIYEMSDVVAAGWKMKKGFEIAEFPNSTDARWGFAPTQSREVAVIRYPTVELARTDGLKAAEEQTEYIEPVDGIRAYGDKVEKTACRGFADYSPPYKLSHTTDSRFGIKGTLILNKGSFTEELSFPLNAECPRREPFYRVYVIEGNLVFLGELLRKEDLEMVNSAIIDLIIKMKEVKNG